MKKKATVKRKASKNKPVKKGPPCIYCGATVYTGVDICSNCHKKKRLGASALAHRTEDAC